MGRKKKRPNKLNSAGVLYATIRILSHHRTIRISSSSGGGGICNSSSNKGR